MYNMENIAKDIPIIIFHIGNQEYVHLCLKQATKYNNIVHILTDNKNYFNYNNVFSINFNEYSLFTNKFKNIYKHFSSNPYNYELICICRWFCIYEYMKKNNIDSAFICDSDVLIYDNISNIIKNYLKEDMYICTSSSKNVTGGQSFFHLEKLEKFVEFCFEFYNTQTDNMINWYKNYKQEGGICDMTLLYYFVNNSKIFVGLRLPDFPRYENDLTNIYNNEFTFDLHLSTYGNHLYPEEYEINELNKNKNIKFIDNKPYCFNKRLNKDIRFVLLHFQGRNKNIMKKFYNICN